MKIAQSIKIGAWLLIGLNMLMAIGAIHVFIRMAPAIEVIINQNERTLQSCEQMLSYLVVLRNPDRIQAAMAKFSHALEEAQKNISEPGEAVAIETIQNHYQSAFAGDENAVRLTTAAITQLSSINRKAMVMADHKAKQVGRAGAWGVVFMALCVFVAGLIFIKALNQGLIGPLAEVHDVLRAHRQGEVRRRCTGVNLSQENRYLFDEVNYLLDQTNSPRVMGMNPLVQPIPGVS